VLQSAGGVQVSGPVPSMPGPSFGVGWALKSLGGVGTRNPDHVRWALRLGQAAAGPVYPPCTHPEPSNMLFLPKVSSGDDMFCVLKDEQGKWWIIRC